MTTGVPWPHIKNFPAENRARAIGQMVCAHLPKTSFTFELIMAVVGDECLVRYQTARTRRGQYGRVHRYPAAKFNEYLAEPGRTDRDPSEIPRGSKALERKLNRAAKRGEQDAIDRENRQRNADRIDGYDRDDLGESPDY